MKSLSVTIQTKATKKCFPVVSFTVLTKGTAIAAIIWKPGLYSMSLQFKKSCFTMTNITLTYFCLASMKDVFKKNPLNSLTAYNTCKL